MTPHTVRSLKEVEEQERARLQKLAEREAEDRRRYMGEVWPEIEETADALMAKGDAVRRLKTFIEA